MRAHSQVAHRTEEFVRGCPTSMLPWRPGLSPAPLAGAHVLPTAHVIAETAQHDGHADIIGESLNGAKSMG